MASIDLSPTLSNITFAVLDTIRSRTNINEQITEEIIWYHIGNIRAQLFNKSYSVDSYVVQEIPCIDIIQVDRGECCEITGCKIYRTDIKIPSPIEGNYKQYLTRIGSIDKTIIPFDFIDYTMVPYIQYSRFTKNRPKVFTMNNNGYLYLILPEGGNFEGLEKISVQGVFEDPRALRNYTTCEGLTCYSDKLTPYPIKSWMIPALIEMTIKMFIKQQSIAPSDQSNDSKLTVESNIEKQ